MKAILIFLSLSLFAYEDELILDLVQSYKITCEKGNLKSCDKLKPSMINAKQQAKNLDKLCKAKNIKACLNLANNYYKGLYNYKKDYKKAGYYFKLACDFGDTKTCKELK